MRLPSEVLIFDAERRRMAWYRPKRRRLPPECVFLALVIGLAVGLYALAAPARPAAPGSITDVAPPCADARQPCRGRAS